MAVNRSVSLCRLPLMVSSSGWKLSESDDDDAGDVSVAVLVTSCEFSLADRFPAGSSDINTLAQWEGVDNKWESDTRQG